MPEVRISFTYEFFYQCSIGCLTMIASYDLATKSSFISMLERLLWDFSFILLWVIAFSFSKDVWNKGPETITTMLSICQRWLFSLWPVEAERRAAQLLEEEMEELMPRRQIARTRLSERVRQDIQVLRLQRRRPAELESSDVSNICLVLVETLVAVSRVLDVVIGSLQG